MLHNKVGTFALTKAEILRTKTLKNPNFRSNRLAVLLSFETVAKLNEHISVYVTGTIFL